MKRQIPMIFACQFLALMVTAWIFRHTLNSDAVAYLELARHYADGQWSLAIAGVWSPLISWSLAVLFKIGLPPLVAARVFMIISAMTFLWGSLRLFRRLELSRPALVCGLWVMAFLSVPWSVENITPDLLVAGLVAMAVSLMASPRWIEKPESSLLCGIIWGVSFLCKSVALPLGIATFVALVLWHWNKFVGQRRKIFRALSAAFAGIILTVAPWIMVLTCHYGTFTVASSASYNHALVGPKEDASRFLIDAGLHTPPAGRVTVWEDPIALRPDWSPFASWSNAMHQAKVILKNIPTVLLMLSGVCVIFPCLLLLAIARASKHKLFPQNCWLPFLPVLFLGALYLPNYLMFTEERYFYPAAPLLFATAVMCRNWRGIGLLLIAASFIVPNVLRAGIRLNALHGTGEYAHDLAANIMEKQLFGPVAGSGKISGGRVGLYIAWWLQQPWFGDEPVPNADDYRHSGASLLATIRGGEIARQLAADPNVRDLDRELFPTPAEAEKCPVKIFHVSE